MDFVYHDGGYYHGIYYVLFLGEEALGLIILEGAKMPGLKNTIITCIILLTITLIAARVFDSIYIARIDNAAGKLMKAQDYWDRRLTHVEEALFGSIKY